MTQKYQYYKNLIKLKQKSMSIIDIINTNIHTLGLTQDGYLLAWNLSPQSLSKQVTKDFPYLSNQFQYKILDSPAINLLKTNKYIFVCGLKQIKVIEINDLQNFIRKYKNQDNKYQLACKTVKQQHGIHTAIIIQNKGENQTEMLDQAKQNQFNNIAQPNSSNHSLLYSTKFGKIFLLHCNFKDTTLICDITSKQIHNNQSNLNHQLNNVGNVIGWHQCVTSMIAYRENSLLLVGTSAGRVLIVSLIGRKIVENVTTRNNLKLGAVQHLVFSTAGHRFYSLHSNCIVEWSMQMQRCLGYYSYVSPYSILHTQKLSLDSSKILISGGNRLIEVIDAENSQIRSQLQTNLESIHILKQINNKVYCGGSNGMIQIFQLGVTDLILFRNQQNMYL